MVYYRVDCVAGAVRHTVVTHLSYDEAYDFCCDNNWEWDYNGGLVWDLDIIEDYSVEYESEA